MNGIARSGPVAWRIREWLRMNLENLFSSLTPVSAELWGTVYRANQNSLGREVLLHVLSDALQGDERHNLLAAVRAAARLSYAGVLHVLEADPDEHPTWFATELPPGRTLDEALRYRTSATLRAQWAADLLDAVAFGHGVGLLHARLSPTAVRVRSDQRVALSHFGVWAPEGHAMVRAFETDAIRYLPARVSAGDEYDVAAEGYAAAALTLDLLRGGVDPDRPPTVHNIDPDLPLAVRQGLTSLLTENAMPGTLRGLGASLRLHAATLLVAEDSLWEEPRTTAGRSGVLPSGARRALMGTGPFGVAPVLGRTTGSQPAAHDDIGDAPVARSLGVLLGAPPTPAVEPARHIEQGLAAAIRARLDSATEFFNGIAQQIA